MGETLTRRHGQRREVYPSAPRCFCIFVQSCAARLLITSSDGDHESVSIFVGHDDNTQDHTVPADHNENFFTRTKRILATHAATRLKPRILRSHFSERMNVVINFCFRLLPANREIVVGLEINPELRRNAEESS